MQNMIFLFGFILSFPLMGQTQSCSEEHTLNVLNKVVTNYTLVTAHRGGHLHAPENSLASIDEAVNVGADIIELDVRLTKDGVAVLLHDHTVDRTTNGQGNITDILFKDISRLRLTEKVGEKSTHLTQYRVPTLLEALNYTKGRIWFHLDLKAYSDKAIAVISADVKKAGLEKLISVYHSNTEVLTKVYQKLPHAILTPMGRNALDAIEHAKTGKYKIVHTQPIYASAEHSKALNSYASSGWINALGAPDKMANDGDVEAAYMPYVAVNANIIQTDQPKLLIDFLESKGKRVKNEGCKN
jgi:glycerophosphoryl diester phosphodiesterase